MCGIPSALSEKTYEPGQFGMAGIGAEVRRRSFIELAEE
jgi:hypothetical protein